MLEAHELSACPSGRGTSLPVARSYVRGLYHVTLVGLTLTEVLSVASPYVVVKLTGDTDLCKLRCTLAPSVL
jgi:hypothetical protein